MAGWLYMLLGFSSLVFVHEFGHFLLAKWNGVRVQVFSIGMGPYLISFRGRETTYVLSLIPLGGYVKMLGQDDLNPDVPANADPRDYRAKPVGARAAIIAAGAVFNILFAFLLLTFCWQKGFEVDAPKIGRWFSPDSPLAATPLRPGDRILAVNGRPVKSLLEARMLIAADDDGEVELDYGDPDRPKTTVVRAKRNKEYGISTLNLHQYQKIVAYRTGFSTGLFVAALMSPPFSEKELRDSPALAAKLSAAADKDEPGPARRVWQLLNRKERQAVRALAGFAAEKPAAEKTKEGKAEAEAEDDSAVEEKNKQKAELVKTFLSALNRLAADKDFYQAKDFTACSADQRVQDFLRREQAGKADQTKAPTPLERFKFHQLLLILSFPDELKLPETPAEKAGLRSGDRIMAVDGREIRVPFELQYAMYRAGGAEQVLTVERRDEKGNRKVFPVSVRAEPRPIGGGRRYLLGVSLAQRVTAIDPRCEAYKANLRTGDFLAGVYEDARDSVPKGERPKLNLAWSKTGRPLQKEDIQKAKIPAETACDSPLLFATAALDKEILRCPGLSRSMVEAWHDVGFYSQMVYYVLRGLLARRISHKSLAGPVMIGGMLLMSAKGAFVDFLWWLAFISVNLGVVQFVPIPLLDGWHLVMLAVEKLKGNPVSQKVQIAFQYVGLVLIGLLFLTVTFNDIARLWRG